MPAGSQDQNNTFLNLPSTEGEANQSDISTEQKKTTKYARYFSEAMLYLLLIVSVWAFGGVNTEWQTILSVLFGLLLCGWLTRNIIYRRFSIRPNWFMFGMLVMICLTAFQLIPLPLSVVSILSPGRAEDIRRLIPEQFEQIDEENAISRPTFFRLTTDTNLTIQFFTELVVLLFVYVICRNWLASHSSIKKLSWVVAINGVLVACFALAQYFLSRKMLFWTFPVETSFGPFVCRNHYPFFAYCVFGVLVGLLLQRNYYLNSSSNKAKDRIYSKSNHGILNWFNQTTQDYQSVVLLTCSLIVAISIPFSLSRGGMISFAISLGFLAFMISKMNKALSYSVLGVIAIMAVGLGAFLGFDPIEKRLAGTGESLAAQDDRTALWKSAFQVWLKYPIFGSGQNTFQRVEPAVRPMILNGDSELINDSVHNEYIEALCEGGIVRFACTLLIVFSAIYSAIRAYYRLGERSNGYLALGMAFGLVGIAVHSLFDFGIHIPAIALLAVVFAAYTESCAVDNDHLATKKSKSNSTKVVSLTEVDTTKKMKSNALVVTGPVALVLAFVLFVFGCLLIRQYRIWDKAERYRVAALNADLPISMKIALTEAAMNASPRDPELQIAYAKAHGDAIAEYLRQNKISLPVNQFKPKLDMQIVEKHVYPALKAIQRARLRCPNLPQPHLRFAFFNDYCKAAQPSSYYLKNVIELAKSDGEVYYFAGLEAFQRKELGEALKYWKNSLALNNRRLPQIIANAKTQYKENDLIIQLLPDSAQILMSAADLIYPDRASYAVERKPFLDKAKLLAEKSTQPNDLITLARALYETGDKVNSQQAFQRAISTRPNDVGIRKEYADWLETEELYEQLIPELEWLNNHNIGSNTKDRLESAKHALILQSIIGKP